MWGNRRTQVVWMLASILAQVLTPLLVTADGPGLSAATAQYLCFGAAFCLGSQHATTAALKENWRLPSEQNWARSVDLGASVVGSLLSCLVVSQLITVLGWRVTMLLLAALTTVALLGFVFFVTEAPAAGSGRLRLSDGEAALFRAVGMLADEPTYTRRRRTCTVRIGYGSILTSGAAWALIVLEMVVAWR